MKAIITVVGKDKAGIVAGVATKIAELGLNIDDISQTVLDEYFTMMAVVSSDEKQESISRVQRFLTPCIISRRSSWILDKLLKPLP